MLTLTSIPGTTVEQMMKAWNRFRGWLKRVNPGFEYAAVKERGSRTGMLHLHIILTGWLFLPHSELQAQWKACSGATFVNVKRLYGTPGSAAEYVSKYVSKALDGESWGKAVTYSRGWPKEREAEKLWTFAGETWPYRQAPSVRIGRVMPGGAILAIDKGCDCTARAVMASLSYHLHLMRLERSLRPESPSE